MNDITIKMTLQKSTKGTHVYGDNGQMTAVRTIYVRKDGLPTPPPQTIELTIKASDGQA